MPDARDGSTWNFLSGGGEMGALMRAFDWSKTPIGDPEGWPQSLRTSVRLLLTTGHPMFIWWGPELIQFYNDAYRQTMGPERHPSALGQRGRECWEEIWHIIGSQVEQVMAGKGATWHVDQLVPVTRHGKREDVWWTYSYGPIDLDDHVGGVLVVCTDVTEQHRAREDLETRVGHLAAERDQLWRSSQDLLVAVGLDGILRSVNPAWTQTFGFAREELEGHHFGEFVHPEDKAVTFAALGSAGNAALRSFQNRYRRRDGTYRWISWSAGFEGGTAFAVGRDITPEKEHAEALRRAEDALRQAQKMEAVGQLTGGLAHDFNNLLQGIIGSLGVIDKLIAVGRGDEVGRFIGTAMNSANRAAALTHRLLAFSRRQPLDPKPVDANQLAAAMEDLLRRTLGESIRLELALADAPWLSLCDHNQLENAILNLAINARDAMPDGGTLTIHTGNVDLDAAEARKRDVTPGQYVCVSVTDTGVGMTPEVLHHAFDPFFTTKPLGQGTGLGLSMIYGFARQSDGYAKIRSEIGKGTTVTLYLPRYRGVSQAAPDAPPARGAEWRHEGGNAVVIEDDAVVRELVVHALRDLGYEVDTAVDGLGGLEIVRSPRPIDLIVTDVGLPGLNGRQVADAALQVHPRAKVLFMTGYAENAAFANGLQGTGMEMITKPFAIDAFAERIQGLMRQ